MSIHKYHLMHGAALFQIVSHESFTALNRLSTGDYGHYLINEDRRLFVKYASAAHSPWQFTFRPEEIERVYTDNQRGPSFVGLVCGTDGVAGVSAEELFTIVDSNPLDQQSVRVERPKGGSYRVSHGGWEIRRRVPSSVFAHFVLTA